MTNRPERGGRGPHAPRIARFALLALLGGAAGALAPPIDAGATGALQFLRNDEADQAAAQTRPGLFDGLFGRRAPQRAALPPPGDPSERVRPGASGQAGRAAPRTAPRSAARSLGRRTICVRTCDGYWFPIGELAERDDLPAHDLACNTGCPGAPTRVFVLPSGSDDVSRARASDGTLYADLPVAGSYTSSLSGGCTCQGPTRRVAARLDIRHDPTLRPGDIVVTNDGPIVYAGEPGDPDTLADFEPIADARIATALREKADARLGISFRYEMERLFLATHTPTGGVFADDTATAALAPEITPGGAAVRRVDVFDIPPTGALSSAGE